MRVAGLNDMPASLGSERALRRLTEAEEDLRHDVAAQQQRWRYRLYRGRVTFEHEALRAQQHLKQRLRTFLAESSFLNLLTTPLILLAPASAGAPRHLGDRVPVGVLSDLRHREGPAA